MHLGRTVAELQDSISSEEFAHWVAFFEFEPYGADAANWRAGMIAATIANAAPRKEGSKPFTPADFMPKRKGDIGDLTPEQRAFVERKAKHAKRRHRQR